MFRLHVISQLWFWWSITSRQKKMLRPKARLQTYMLRNRVLTGLLVCQAAGISSSEGNTSLCPHQHADIRAEPRTLTRRKRLSAAVTADVEVTGLKQTMCGGALTMRMSPHRLGGRSRAQRVVLPSRHDSSVKP